MKVCCEFSLESRPRGDSYECTQYLCQIKKENYPKLSYICSFGIVSKGLNDECETAVVNGPLVFQPQKFYCILVEYILAN